MSQEELTNRALKRVEELTLQLAKTDQELTEAKATIAWQKILIDSTRKSVYEEMAAAAINCGPHSGCWLARRRLK